MRFLDFWARKLYRTLDPKQTLEVFTEKAVVNFRYLATAPWKRRGLKRPDIYWRQGYKTAWKLVTQ